MNSPGRLGLFDSQTILPIQTLGPGTYEVKLLTQGNSLISTVFVESMSGGASVKVNWWDFGVGGDNGERVNLQSHPLISSAPVSDRIIVSRIHDKPVAEIVITGGSVTLGIYVTVVSSFASDSDAALVLDGQAVDLTQDRGNPKGIYDPVAHQWFLARGSMGVQDVNITGGSIMVTTAPFVITNKLSGSADDLAYGATATVIDYTASVAFLIADIMCGGDDDGLFSISINGSLFAELRNSYMERQVSIESSGQIKVNPGDHIVITVQNVSVSQAGTANYKAFAYYG